MNFSYDGSDGWIFLIHLLAQRYDKARNDLLLCALQIVAPHINNRFVEDHAAVMLLVLASQWRDIFDFNLKMFDNRIDVKWQPDGYSILLLVLGWGWKREQLCDDLHMILTKGADPHLIGFNANISPQKETPTSIAMYNSWAFVSWRSALLRISTDLEIFVRKELKQSPLKKAGWHENSLLSLFQRHIDSAVPKLNCPCDRCGGEIDELAELPWCRWLDCIKQV